MTELKPEENKQIGGNIQIENKFIEDEVSKRINWLIQNRLKKIAKDESGWLILYQDPNDNRYWELSYPQSEIHGGGMPMLVNISKELAYSKYKLNS
jgi:hypothetical protein